ncbi:hypothetical protein F5B22DRAFT_264818 [Xylaria bambusicola]|uniref:uncharacterized protein n=1 Tax=Xylaria bambusicola TaxID=326684 RepID=UPI002007F1F2|nr:uncharacterized protein F5B22DRAFT_264818 [Xylaria bambusicola]KAI0526018.1 hypothetical protein F5B22DRAFT_264818 [Xylaria bambusicola]
MRHNVAKFTLFASLMGVSAVDQHNTEPVEPVITFDALGRGYTVFLRFADPPPTFHFNTKEDVTINAIKLQRFIESGDVHGNNDELIAIHVDSSLGSATGPPTTATTKAFNLRAADQPTSSNNNATLILNNHTISIQWSDVKSPDWLKQPLYVKCEWTSSTDTGNSTSQVFSAVDDVSQSSEAATNVQRTGKGEAIGGKAPAARDEFTKAIPNQPPSTTTPNTSTSTPNATHPAGTISPVVGTSTQNGLSKGATIGVAVGVSVAGLIIAGVLAWLFWFRRRRNQKNSKTHHMMQSYSSDVGGQAMITDKEMPVVRESNSPQSVYDSRPSGDVYAPYSDRSTTSPVPQPPQHHQQQHHRTTSSNVTSAAAAAAIPVSPAGASETDISWGRGAPTPTSIIASRYAHLVEEGMTEDEIRRLEEEERQLDAAIENAGRRGHNNNST